MSTVGKALAGAALPDPHYTPDTSHETAQPLTFETGTAWSARKAPALLESVFDDRTPYSTIGFHVLRHR